MKKELSSQRKIFIVFIVLLMSIFSFSQSEFSYGRGGRILRNGVLLNQQEVQSVLSSNQQALELYQIGRNKKTFGNILLYGSILPIGYFVKNQFFENNVSFIGPNGNYSNGPIVNKPSLAPLIIGAAMIIAAIPIKIGFSKKIKQAIQLANQMPKTATNFEFDTALVVNQNGVGFQLTF